MMSSEPKNMDFKTTITPQKSFASQVQGLSGENNCQLKRKENVLNQHQRKGNQKMVLPPLCDITTFNDRSSEAANPSASLSAARAVAVNSSATTSVKGSAAEAFTAAASYKSMSNSVPKTKSANQTKKNIPNDKASKPTTYSKKVFVDKKPGLPAFPKKSPPTKITVRKNLKQALKEGKVNQRTDCKIKQGKFTERRHTFTPNISLKTVVETTDETDVEVDNVNSQTSKFFSTSCENLKVNRSESNSTKKVIPGSIKQLTDFLAADRDVRDTQFKTIRQELLTLKKFVHDTHEAKVDIERTQFQELLRLEKKLAKMADDEIVKREARITEIEKKLDATENVKEEMRQINVVIQKLRQEVDEHNRMIDFQLKMTEGLGVNSAKMSQLTEKVAEDERLLEVRAALIVDLEAKEDANRLAINSMNEELEEKKQALTDLTTNYKEKSDEVRLLSKQLTIQREELERQEKLLKENAEVRRNLHIAMESKIANLEEEVQKLHQIADMPDPHPKF